MAIVDFDIIDALARLRKHVPDSDERLEPARRNRYRMVQEIAGKHYSARGAKDRTPLPMMEMYATTYVRSLIGTNPAALGTTDNRSLKVLANSLGMATTQTFKQIKIAKEWAKCVMESMVALGVCYYGLTNSGNSIETPNGKIPLGRPFAKSIPFDDFVIDMNATSFDPNELDFVGHRYVMPIKTLQASPQNDQDMVAKLQPMRGLERRGRRGGSRRTSSIGHEEGSTITLRDKAELLDLCIPEQQIIITIDADLNLPRPLRVRPYSGPDMMPYDFLGYTDIPSNLLKLPPLSNLQDLHILANTIFNKASRDALAAKQNIYAMGQARRDAERVMNAPNGAVVIGQNPPEMLSQIRFRGADQADIATVLQCKEFFNTYGGNIEALAGLGPQSDTLGQDEMIVSAARGKLGEMKKEAMAFFNAGTDKIAKYLFTDPYMRVPLTYRLPGYEEFEASDVLTAADMRGEFVDFNFKIVPFSEEDQTPQQKLQSSIALFREIAPFLEMAAQQGSIFQVPEFIRSLAELANVTDVVNDWFMSAEPTQPPIGEMPRKMGGNGGEYIHRNVSGTSRQGQATRTMQSMLAASASNDNGSMVGA